jgi:hypothetical protein
MCLVSTLAVSRYLSILGRSAALTICSSHYENVMGTCIQILRQSRRLLSRRADNWSTVNAASSDANTTSTSGLSRNHSAGTGCSVHQKIDCVDNPLIILHLAEPWAGSDVQGAWEDYANRIRHKILWSCWTTKCDLKNDFRMGFHIYDVLLAQPSSPFPAWNNSAKHASLFQRFDTLGRWDQLEPLD